MIAATTAMPQTRTQMSTTSSEFYFNQTQDENDKNNDFVDSNNGSISGTVKTEEGQPLKDVQMQLKDSSGAIIKIALTNPLGGRILVP